MFWIVLLALIAAALVVAAISDLRDRRAGHKLRSAAEIGQGVHDGKHADRAEFKRARERRKQSRSAARKRRTAR